MGRVFTYDEIEAGRIPEADDFGLAQQLFVDLADEAIHEGQFDGAFIFGSAAIGLANRRSDLDVFISLTDGNVSNYEAARHAVEAISLATGRRVPVVPIIQTVDALVEGRHEMDRLFGEHLTSPYRTVRGEDPTSYTQFSNEPLGKIVSDYLAHKKRRLANTYMNVTPVDLEAGKGLQRFLELPVAVGRKALQAFNEIGQGYGGATKSADKVAVTEQVHVLMEALELDEGFEDQLNANETYDEALADAIEGNLSRREYKAELLDLYDRIPGALIWIDQLETELVPKLRHHNNS